MQLAVDIRSTFFSSHPSANTTTISALVSTIVKNAYVLAGVILFIYLLFGGFTIITSAGSADETQKGQKAITSAIMGFILIFASYWIIQIIQVLTGLEILSGGGL